MAILPAARQDRALQDTRRSSSGLSDGETIRRVDGGAVLDILGIGFDVTEDHGLRWTDEVEKASLVAPKLRALGKPRTLDGFCRLDVPVSTLQDGLHGGRFCHQPALFVNCRWDDTTYMLLAQSLTRQ